MQAILGRKLDQTQMFLTDGSRIPVTMVEVMDNPVVMIKTQAKDGYTGVQLGYGTKKHPNKSASGHIKGAKLEKAPLFLREIRVADDASDLPTVGDVITAEMVLKPGDIIDVTGMSKGKGFAGGVKRHHFKGGPRTHGQSDRERAPGSIGQTTTPGRVYKGKRMAGKMGNEQVTMLNLEVVDVEGSMVLVKGLVPGIKKSLVIISKKGENKKFVPLLKEAASTSNLADANAAAANKTEEIKAEEKVAEEVKVEEPKVETVPAEAVKTETTEEVKEEQNG